MLSAAKHLARWAEMLRCAQHDKQDGTGTSDCGRQMLRCAQHDTLGQHRARGQQPDASLRSG